MPQGNSGAELKTQYNLRHRRLQVTVRANKKWGLIVSSLTKRFFDKKN